MRGLHFHLHRTTKRTLNSVAIFALLLSITGSRAPTTLETIIERGVLRVATFQGSTTFYEDAKGSGGFEYILSKAFADSLGVELEMTVFKNLKSLFVAIGGPKADFAAAGLAVTPQRQTNVRFSQPYDQITQQLIYRMGNKKPSEERGISGQKLVVIAGSSHAENLAKHAPDIPGLVWEERNGVEMLELLEMVHTGEIDLTVVDSNAYLVDRSLYPKTKVAMDVSEPESLAWAFPKFGDTTLLNSANQFISAYEQTGQLQKLKQRVMGPAQSFNFAGSQLFMRRIDSRLKGLKPLFITAADKYNIDWHLLAAISYQESHWNPTATSPTGVRGLMMLTRNTAKEMGIKNRIDPEQSLDGGTRYFLKSKKKIPKDINDPDRTWFALATYNVGYGHLEDARVLTQRAGKNPDLWKDVKEFLPLLQKEKYYSTVRYGYARGQEPVQYVKNIRHYQSILRWHSLETERRNRQQNRLLQPNIEDRFNQVPRPL